MERVINAGDLHPEGVWLLAQSWIFKAASEHLGIGQWGTSSTPGEMTFGVPDKRFQVTVSENVLTLDLVEGLDETTVVEIIDAAIAKVEQRDFGTTIAYWTEGSLGGIDLQGRDLVHYLRLIGSTRHIEEPRRISDLALIDFAENVATPEQLASAPVPIPTTFRMTIFVTAPCICDLSQRQATPLAELVAAVIAFAVGQPVNYRKRPWELEGQEAEDAIVRRVDWDILQIARDGVSLDIFGILPTIGGEDAFQRVCGSLLAYHAALKQENADVAVILFVTSIEALIAPRQPWGKDAVTKRFIKTLIDLCPEAVDELVRHDNVEGAFEVKLTGGPNTRRKTLLSKIYETRSLPTHAGLTLSSDIMQVVRDPTVMRVALLDYLAREAIKAYLLAPRSSLIGHPADNPDVPSRV